MKILLGTKELVLTSASVLRTMDTGADEWNAVVEWTSGRDPEFDKLVKPRTLTESIVSINEKKLITGNLYRRSPTLVENKSALALRGFSKTYRLIKSNPKAQIEFLNQSLLDITRAFSLPFGLFTAVRAPEELVNEIFKKETIPAQSTVFTFLQNLARQRSILTSSDNDGNLFYLQAKLRQKPVGSIIEGEDGTVPITKNFSASFDDSEVFQTYQAVNDSPFAYLLKEPQGITKDDRIKIPSFKTIVTNSLEKGAGQKTVEFARNQTIAKSMSMPFEVNGWYAPNGELWQEDTLVSVVSPTLFTPDGFTYLIRAVQYNLDGRGETAVLSLVPPSLFTGDPVVEPWG